MLWQPICEEKICVIDKVISLSENDITQLSQIASEFEFEKYSFDLMTLKISEDKSLFTLYADKVDYFGVEIMLEYKDKIWKKINVIQSIY